MNLKKKIENYLLVYTATMFFAGVASCTFVFMQFIVPAKEGVIQNKQSEIDNLKATLELKNQTLTVFEDSVRKLSTKYPERTEEPKIPAENSKQNNTYASRKTVLEPTALKMFQGKEILGGRAVISIRKPEDSLIITSGGKTMKIPNVFGSQYEFVVDGKVYVLINLGFDDPALHGYERGLKISVYEK